MAITTTASRVNEVSPKELHDVWTETRDCDVTGAEYLTTVMEHGVPEDMSLAATCFTAEAIDFVYSAIRIKAEVCFMYLGQRTLSVDGVDIMDELHRMMSTISEIYVIEAELIQRVTTSDAQRAYITSRACGSGLHCIEKCIVSLLEKHECASSTSDTIADTAVACLEDSILHSETSYRIALDDTTDTMRILTHSESSLYKLNITIGYLEAMLTSRCELVNDITHQLTSGAIALPTAKYLMRACNNIEQLCTALLQAKLIEITAAIHHPTDAMVEDITKTASLLIGLANAIAIEPVCDSDMILTIYPMLMVGVTAMTNSEAAEYFIANSVGKSENEIKALAKTTLAKLKFYDYDCIEDDDDESEDD